MTRRTSGRAWRMPWVVLVLLHGLVATAQAAPLFHKVLRVNTSQVTGGPLTNFPLLFNSTDPALRTTLNGGRVTNVNGWDIIFATTPGILEALAHLDPQAPTDLEPALRLGYLRERFVEPASASRLNLDSELIALEVAPWCRDAGCGREVGNLLELAVVELKGEFRELPLLLGALHGLGARRGSLSKYTACMTTDAL